MEKGEKKRERETLEQSGNKFVIILKIKIQKLISSDFSDDDFL